MGEPTTSQGESGRRGAFGTRRAIIDQLKTTGPMDTRALGAALGVTATAIGQHLAQLRQDGMVTFEDVPNGRGRPQRHWSLTDNATALFPDHHDELMAGMLTAVQETFGPAGMERLLEARAEQQRTQYAREIDRNASLQERVQQLAAIRSREGYMAEVEAAEGGAGWQLIENHCPICTAAKTCQGFCAKELEVFRTVLGPAARVERTEHIIAGSRRCVYSVESAAENQGVHGKANGSHPG